MRLRMIRARRRMRRWSFLQCDALRRGRALAWRRFYIIRHRYQVWRRRHGAIAGAVLLAALVAVSAFYIPALQDSLEPLFDMEERVQGLRSLLQTLGGALLGATAIVSSLVLFSMQVNVERMPHGLFQRLSTDRRLLLAFAAAFLLAVIVAALSLIPDKFQIAVAIFIAFWAIVVILFLFLYGYRRALVLINPRRQLELVTANTRQVFRAWVRSAKRAAPLLTDPSSPPSGHKAAVAQQHDMTRVAYFQLNPHWTNGAKQAVRYAVSLARRYAEQGDHEVSAAAMNAIIAINAAYVEAKGKTFFNNQLMFDNPLTTDKFINETLEHLRQTSRIGISRGDEQQIEQTLQSFAALVGVYAAIDYSSRHASKTHAHLAAGYLTQEVKSVVQHNMPDVLMEGARQIGQCASVLLAAEGPIGIQTVVQQLGIIAGCGAAKENYRPVTLICVEQLARLSFDVIGVRSHDVQFAAKEIRSTISLVARAFLTVPDAHLMSNHSTYLGPYYSATDSNALCARLVALANALAGEHADNGDARQIINNIEQWADGLYQTEKEILLEAIKRRSQFTFEMIHWIGGVTGVLIFISNAPACDERTRGDLRKHALWLISVLSFVPDDVDTVKFIENFRMTETLFDAALDAHYRDCPDVVTAVADLLISWMFKGGLVNNRATLELSTYGLAVLALLALADGAIVKLKANIGKRLAAGALPDQEVRDRVAREIRGRASTLYRTGHWSSSIEQAMAQMDHAKLGPLLEELADLISPGTAGQAATRHFI